LTCKLSVNLNAIAMLRNRRDLPWPSVTELGRMALEAGAYGLTVHPRPDERHIRKTDVFDVQEMMRRGFMDKEYNIEGYPDERFMAIVEEVVPTQVTLVPDDPSQDTSDHGWDFAANMELLQGASERLKAKGMRVAMFADADAETVVLAKDAGADRVELYTGPYGSCHDDPAQQAIEMEKLVSAGMMATQAGLGLNAGHDLTLDNLMQLVFGMPFLEEVSIGHCITGDALKYGMAGAVERYRAACGDPVGVNGMMVRLYGKLKKVLGNELAALEIAGQMYGQYRRTGECSYYHVLLDRQKSGEIIAKSQLEHALSVDLQLSKVPQSSFVSEAEERRISEFQKILDNAIGQGVTASSANEPEIEMSNVSAMHGSVAIEKLPVEERENFKKRLISERNLSNSMAEKFLDLQGWPRPEGWHSVFFYPDSIKPRGLFIVILSLVIVSAWAVF